MEKKVYIGNDTAGYYLKSKCIEYLEGKGIPYVDCGSDDNPDIEATRYPFFAAKVAKAVASGEARCGLLICGTGIGISMAANKFKGVRAALVNSTYLARMTRRHNDANILCLGGRTIGVNIIANLNINLLATTFCNEVNFFLIKLTNVDFIATAHKFYTNNIFVNSAVVHISTTK